MVVDHCHTTGKVRGLLCTRCNNTLGGLKDSVDLAKKMIVYLEDHNDLIPKSNGKSYTREEVQELVETTLEAQHE